MTSGLTTFTAAHRVVMRIHYNATVVWTTSEPTRATGFTGAFKRMIRIADTTNSSFASTENLTSFT
jgi:hypothetical protein